MMKDIKFIRSISLIIITSVANGKGAPRYEFLSGTSLQDGQIEMEVSRSFTDEVVLKKERRQN